MASSAKPLPLRCRILGALELAPMTLRQLSTCLSVGEVYARHMLAELRKLGAVTEAGVQRHGDGRPWKVWSLAA